MADNTLLSAGTGGDTLATDDVGGVKHQRVKLSVGADGIATDAVPVSNGMDVTGTAVQAVGLVGQLDDTGTGAVTENQFAPVRISTRRALLIEGVASGTAVPISAASLPLPTGAGTAANQATLIASLAGGALNQLDYDSGGGTQNMPLVGIGIPASGGAVAGGTTTNPIQVGVPADPFGANADAAVAAGAAGSIQAKLRRATQGLEDLKTLIVLAAGANAIGKLAANSGVTIGAVELAAAQTLATLTTLTTLTGSGIAHGSADSGNPHKIGGRADTTFQAAAADGNRVDALFDVYGVLSTREDHPNKWSYHEDSSSALSGATVQSAPGASLSVYISDVIVSLGAATALNLKILEGSTVILGPYYLEAINGRSIHIRLRTPKKCTANTAILVTTSAALAHGVDILGFIAP